MTRQLGAEGERQARFRLQAAGYRILAQNWRSSHGELDIVAQEGETLVFVEVKTRRNRRAGTPEEAVTRRKARRLLRTAQAYLADHELDVDWRVDVIAIEVDGVGRVCRYDHITDAVQGW